MTLLGVDYQVRECAEAEMGDALGETDFGHASIKVCSDLSPPIRKRVLSHEGLHVLSYEFGIGLNERQVTQLTVALELAGAKLPWSEP